MCPSYQLEHLLDICPGEELRDPPVVLCPIFWGTTRLISRVVVPAFNPTSNGEVFFLSPHPCQNLLSPEFFILAILTGVRWISGLFWFAFPWWLKMLNICLGASPSFDIIQLRILCLVLYTILKELFGSLDSNFLTSLYVLDISPISDVRLEKIFSQSVGCYFVLLTASFTWQNFYNFMRSYLSIADLRA